MPSPYFMPILAKNSTKLSVSLFDIIPFNYTYMFLMIFTKSAGIFNYSTSTYHSLALFTLSYARFKSTNARLSGFFDITLCCIIVCSMRACSVVLWCALNPACVGAWRLSSVALSVRRRFMTAMNSFANGGVIAMLR